MDNTHDDTSHELEELLTHYVKQWRREVIEGLHMLALDAVSEAAPSDRELAARIRALGVLASSGRRVSKLLKAHQQRHLAEAPAPQRAPGRRVPRVQPTLSEVRAEDLPVQNFWPGHHSNEGPGLTP